MSNTDNHTLMLLKKGIWIYFLLILFEGALRKWVLPSLATPLLVVRDPIALWLLYTAWQKGLLPKSGYLTGMMVLACVAMVTAMLFGHRSLPVALFGARIFLLHFPLMFVIGRVFDKEDVLQIGRVLLWISIPMVLLIGMQFYSPQNAWVNKSVAGGDGGAGFSGAMGFFRPPGTFSFTTGNSLFFEFVAVYVIYFWLQTKSVNLLSLVGASVAVVASIPLSISRGLFFTIVVIIFFAVLATLQNRKYLGKMLTAGFVIFIGLAILSQTATFQTATEAFMSRFTNANESEGGLEGTLGDRYLGGMVTALANSGKQPFFGYGIGMGTNAGAMLLTGSAAFLISEEEWGRVLGEMGTLIGLGIIFIRLGFCYKIAVFSYKKMSMGETLPWMLLSLGLLNIPQGQWAQPTNLGFSVMLGGLIIAAMRERRVLQSEQPEVPQNEQFDEPLMSRAS
jgi:hypothetical protein